MAGIASYFQLKKRKTDVATEVRAGVTTFLVMAYIIFVNANTVSQNNAALANVPGAAWFNLFLNLTMEGYFGDPMYGGNKDKVGNSDQDKKAGASDLDKNGQPSPKTDVGGQALLDKLGATPEQIAALIKVGKPSTNLLIKPKLALAI